MAAQPDMDLAALRDMLDGLSVLAKEPADVTYEEVVAGGRPALWCIPAGAGQDRVLLYAHGGAFMANSMHSHRKLAAHVAKAAGARALVVDFRLAPEHPFPAQLDDATAAYRWLLGQGIEPAHIATVGDSGGGNLAVTLVLKLRDEGLPRPAAIAGMSPWFDMEASGEGFDANAANDAFLARPVVQNLAATFLGESGSPADPLANPLYADLAGLPPVYLSYGGYETLRDNAERFAVLARHAGVQVSLELSAGMQHDYPLMAGRAPEADRTIANIGHWLRPRLGLS